MCSVPFCEACFDIWSCTRGYPWLNLVGSILSASRIWVLPLCHNLTVMNSYLHVSLSTVSIKTYSNISAAARDCVCVCVCPYRTPLHTWYVFPFQHPARGSRLPSVPSYRTLCWWRWLHLPRLQKTQHNSDNNRHVLLDILVIKFNII